MIKDIHNSVTAYADTMKKAQDVHRQAVDYIKANYKDGGEMFKSAMKTATDTFDSAITPMRDSHIQKVTDEMNQARTAVKKVVAVAPSADVLTMLPLVQSGAINEAELQILLDVHKGNYMDSKLLYNAMGKGLEFRTVEAVLEKLDMLEDGLKEYFKTFNGESMDRMSWNNACVLNGFLTTDISAMVNDFLTVYGGQGSDNA